MSPARALRQPTVISLVEELLRASDDFLSVEMLIAAIPGSYASQISVTLQDLRRYRACDVVVNADGKGWWYALPPGNDTRRRKYKEISQGIRRKPHKRAAKKKES